MGYHFEYFAQWMFWASVYVNTVEYLESLGHNINVWEKANSESTFYPLKKKYIIFSVQK